MGWLQEAQEYQCFLGFGLMVASWLNVDAEAPAMESASLEADKRMQRGTKGSAF